MIMTQEKQKSFITAKDKELFQFFHDGAALSQVAMADVGSHCSHAA